MSDLNDILNGKKGIEIPGVKTSEELEAEACFQEILTVLKRHDCSIVPVFIIAGMKVVTRWEVVSNKPLLSVVT